MMGTQYYWFCGDCGYRQQEPHIGSCIHNVSDSIQEIDEGRFGGIPQIVVRNVSLSDLEVSVFDEVYACPECHQLSTVEAISINMRSEFVTKGETDEIHWDAYVFEGSQAGVFCRKCDSEIEGPLSESQIEDACSLLIPSICPKCGSKNTKQGFISTYP